MTTSLRLDEITAEPQAWPRTVLDEERVQEFVELYRDDGLTALPPLLVIERAGDYLLADGWHRHEALRRLGSTEVVVDLVSANGHDGVTVAYEIGLRTAATAPRPLTRAEKQAAVRRLTVAGGRTDEEIAALVGVARSTVWRLRTGPVAVQHRAGDGEGRYAPSADELAARLVRDLDRIWQARGFTDVARDRLPRNLAGILRETFGDEEALVWARRLAAWTADAVQRLERDAER